MRINKDIFMYSNNFLGQIGNSSLRVEAVKRGYKVCLRPRRVHCFSSCCSETCTFQQSQAIRSPEKYAYQCTVQKSMRR